MSSTRVLADAIAQKAVGLIDDALAGALHNMVGFRNVAVHEYDVLDLGIAERVIRHELDALLAFAGLLMQRYLTQP